jgi:hypothetical protein
MFIFHTGYNALRRVQALHLLHTVGARKTVQTLNFELQAVPVAYKLTYFDLPGLAETTRLCFAATGTPFEDVRLPNYQAFQVFSSLLTCRSVGCLTEIY